MGERKYVLTLHNHYHEDVFMGGDSSCFASPIYYLTVKAKMTAGGTGDDGYGVMFEESSDECYALFRVREKMGKVSVVQMFDGGDRNQVYIRQKPAWSLRPNDENKLAVLAIHQEHWFYINDCLVGYHMIPRLPISRLDVAIVAGSQQQVVCQFQDFRVYVP
jgi:hypothetical protein